MENVEKTTEAGMLCIIDGDTFFPSQRTHGLETQVYSVTSQMMILFFLMSSSMS